MTLRLVALLGIVLSPLGAQWRDANLRAIGHLHGARRIAAARVFARTLAEASHSATPAVAPRDPRALARQILSDSRRFSLQAAPARPRTIFDRLHDWWGRLWDRLWSGLSRSLHVPRSLGTGIGNLILFLLLAAFVVVAVRLLISLAREGADVRSTGVPLSPAPSARALYARAGEAATRGEYARAIELLFSAAVVLLDLRGVLHDDASATVNEFRRDLRVRKPALTPAFDVLARALVETAYAEHAAGEPEWIRARQAYDELARSENVRAA